MIWRNERSLYKRKSDVPGNSEMIISMYAPEKDNVVYEQSYWWSDNWDPMEYKTEYDFLTPFFGQFKNLFKRVPQLSLSVKNMVNSPYCNVSADEKDCYLISASGSDERVLYSNRIAFTKDSCDLYISDRNELCYEVVDSSQCYRLFFSEKCDSCVDSYFLYDCSNCQNCFGCAGLRNKNFFIYNEPYKKEDYLKKIKEFDLENFDFLEKEKKHLSDLSRKIPRRFMSSVKSTDCTGDNIKNSKNCKYGFDVFSTEDSKYLTWTGFGMKDSYDIGVGGGVNLELLYETWDISYGGNKILFSAVSYGCHDLFYSMYCHGSHHLFGCVGLRNKEYCILNRQYTKEEYEVLVPKIIQHMKDSPYIDKNGRVYGYGEFFPFELSPFAYNETIVQEYFPLTKEQAVSQGYAWRDGERGEYKTTKSADNIPTRITEVSDEIVNEIIGCIHKKECIHQCIGAFRIVPQELEFYQKMKLPLPRLCPNCRHEERLKKRNPMKLWRRKCQCAGKTSENGIYKNTTVHQHVDAQCLNQFETSYSPDRPEIVYCEQCYQAEVV